MYNKMRLTVFFLSATPALAAVNGPCYGSGGIAGVCISSTDCESGGGTSTAGACPWDAADIRCCSKPSCQNSGSACSWQSDCAGTSTAGLCPGPSQMQCCSSTEDGSGGYPAPKIPSVGACEQVAVNGATAVVSAFSGFVRELFCTRDCSCPGSSDHCCGKAIDYMIADGGGVSCLPARS